MPKRCSVEHEHVNTHKSSIYQYEGKKRIEDWSRRQPCIGCLAQAKVDGSFNYATEGDNKKRWMDKDGVRINGTAAWACNKCKVNLCEACLEDFDHARGCLMGQKVAV